MLRRGLRVLCAFLLAAGSGCAPVRGYPSDPEDTAATLDNLQPYFDGTKDAAYSRATGADRVRLRDEIVLGRMRGYSISFTDFERRLFGDGNGIAVGGDLILLALGGLGATIGGEAAKAALAAASAGVAGAQSAISKDLYFQRTIPALLAEMEASRAQATATILDGLTHGDAEYPLGRAYLDLDRLKAAGSIPGAVSGITQQAETARRNAEQVISFVRDKSFVDQEGNRTRVKAALAALTDPQAATLAGSLNGFLQTRDAKVRDMVAALATPAQLQTDGSLARQILKNWINHDAMDDAAMQTWLAAIARAQT